MGLDYKIAVRPCFGDGVSLSSPEVLIYEMLIAEALGDLWEQALEVALQVSTSASHGLRMDGRGSLWTGLPSQTLVPSLAEHI